MLVILVIVSNALNILVWLVGNAVTYLLILNVLPKLMYKNNINKIIR